MRVVRIVVVRLLLAQPEQRDAADQVATAAQQRKRRDLDFVVAAVEGVDANEPMYRPSLPQGDQQRGLLGWQNVSVDVAKQKDAPRLVERDAAHVIEALAQEVLGRFVEEQQIAVVVRQPDRHGQPVGQLAHEYQTDVALCHDMRIVPELKRRIC
jgi:hypothetical protein